MFEKNNDLSTELITKIVVHFHVGEKLSPVERRFLNLPFDISKLSLTDQQDMNHQLRFYEESFGKMTVNQVAIKTARVLDRTIHDSG
ncbi:hypothetical protein [Levilactobacillus yiduensis]|uniref:hypothetical protein n=1 Tax=Levilactobacillus yiduensis TaxID=2953880 RepID=UPI000EF2EEC3|nr:hypothetical protein [Levilactobacillus yiduensis]AYM02838.1 hypothetical protein D8911_07460 [Levilactobacillus brevis]